MKCTVLQENLRSALVNVCKAVPTKPQISILSSVLITVKETGIELSATGLYFGVRTTVSASDLEPGSLAIPGKTLLETINSFGAGTIALESANTVLKLQSGSNLVEIHGQAPDEFPAFPEKAGQQYQLPVTQLTEIDKYVRFSVGNDPTRLVLTALLFEFTDNAVKVVGTDGFRLSVLTTQLDSATPAEKFLLPARAISEVCRIAEQLHVSTVEFFLSRDLKQVLFTVDTTEVFVRLIDGDYPPYEKIMPASFTVQVSWDGEEFLAQLKRALIFARETSNIIRLKFHQGMLTLSSTSTLQGSYTGSMTIEMHSGDPAQEYQIAFNARYLMEMMSNTKPTNLHFGMNESLKPALFRPDNKENYSYIVMPFRVNDG